MADTPLSVADVDDADAPRPGIGLCLSGGGYRATLFHVGALLRLNEARLLPQLKRVASVSGGSISQARIGARGRPGVSVELLIGHPLPHRRRRGW